MEEHAKYLEEIKVRKFRAQIERIRHNRASIVIQKAMKIWFAKVKLERHKL